MHTLTKSRRPATMLWRTIVAFTLCICCSRYFQSGFSVSAFSSASSSVQSSKKRQQHRHHLLGAAGSTTTTTSIEEELIDCDVAIYGGGFGGLYAALTLAGGNPNLDIVLVEPTESFVFLPLLYDLTIGTATEAEVCPSYNDLLSARGGGSNNNPKKKIRHIRASLVSLDARTSPQQRAPIAQCSNGETIRPHYAAIMAVGASPNAILGSVPGATQYARPFYTEADAKRTRRWLNKMDERLTLDRSNDDDDVKKKLTTTPLRRIAVVGGGYGGVELAACLQRRWNNIPNMSPVQVSLLSRGALLGGTRAESLVEQALTKLGVIIENVSVEELLPTAGEGRSDEAIRVKRTAYETGAPIDDDETPFDAVFWTAGSKPALPDSLTGLQRTQSGRLAVRPSLQCIRYDGTAVRGLWAVGDCSEVPGKDFPKTGSVALQQGIAVAQNIQTIINGGYPTAFEYRELGSFLTLGGPNAAVLAPKHGPLAPFLTPLFDVADEALSYVDKALQSAPDGLKVDSSVVSFGSHGLGAEVRNDSSAGVLAGSLSGAIRRTVYAALMPTNTQRVIALLSASVSTTTSLIKEITAEKTK